MKEVILVENAFLADLVINNSYPTVMMRNSVGAGGKRKNRHRWAIILKYEGETVYRSDGKSYISNANNIIVLPKGCSYEWQCVKEGSFASAEFDCEISCHEVFSFSVKSNEKILSLMKRMAGEGLRDASLSRLERIRDVYSILLLLATAEPKKYNTSSSFKKIESAFNYISEHYTEKLTNDGLAALTGLSTVYFRKLFAQLVGMPPMDYVQHLRIEKAKAMLESDYTSVTDIALMLGYQNIYDFSRAFKKRVGVPPTVFGSHGDVAREIPC